MLLVLVSVLIGAPSTEGVGLRPNQIRHPLCPKSNAATSLKLPKFQPNQTPTRIQNCGHEIIFLEISFRDGNNGKDTTCSPDEPSPSVVTHLMNPPRRRLRHIAGCNRTGSGSNVPVIAYDSGAGRVTRGQSYDQTYKRKNIVSSRPPTAILLRRGQARSRRNHRARQIHHAGHGLRRQADHCGPPPEHPDESRHPISEHRDQAPRPSPTPLPSPACGPRATTCRWQKR